MGYQHTTLGGISNCHCLPLVRVATGLLSFRCVNRGDPHTMRKVVIMALILSAVFMAEGQKDSVKELENSNDLNNLVNTIVSWGEIGNARGLYAVMQLLTRSTRDGAD